MPRSNLPDETTLASERREIERYIKFGPHHGTPPRWFWTIQIARYCRISLAQVEAMGEEWRERIKLLMEVEREALEYFDEQTSRQSE
jgi:hypothetical protein